ncbi:hypothetical protein [Motilibacter aurantiacus]|uniref:hypothetical protein n=1 Tax=Motilibacter aurantiacus TaxID=2714955 RepID=UPI0014091CCC|nr:hypothetical protein [Motilibacter aurantiacus]NHC44492.1 hypothetical protein [Motilibacter aurantiacus]
MTQDTGSTPSGQDREGARAAMQDLPGETALGNVDPATATSPDQIGRRAEDVAAEAGFTASEPGGGDSAASSSRAESDAGSTAAPTGIADLDRSTSDTPLGDMSTGGEAAREAIGVDPSDNRFGQVPDNSTGEATRAEVLGDQA